VVLKNEFGEVISGDEKTTEWCNGYFEKLYNEGFTGDRIGQQIVDVELVDEMVTLSRELELEPS